VTIMPSFQVQHGISELSTQFDRIKSPLNASTARLTAFFFEEWRVPYVYQLCANYGGAPGNRTARSTKLGISLRLGKSWGV